MKSNNIKHSHSIFKRKLSIRKLVFICALCIIGFGVYYLYETLNQEIINTFDVILAIALIVFAMINIIAYHYYRLILTNTSLIQRAIFNNRIVVFDQPLTLTGNNIGYYEIHNSNQKIKIRPNIELQDELIQRLTDIIHELS